MIPPKLCPFCSYASLHTVRPSSWEWLCDYCDATFIVVTLPTETPSPVPPPSTPPPPERQDFIAKAYRGQLSVSEALALLEGLTWRTRVAVNSGKPYTSELPGPFAGQLEIAP